MTRLTESYPKRFRLGTHRAVDPGETLDRLRPLMPVMGITRVANVTGLDAVGLPVVMVCRPNSRSLAVSQGKGLTLDAAKVSGLMEAAELFHAERVDRPLRLASLHELRTGYRVVDVSRLPRTTVSIFDSHHRTLWIEGYDLVGEEHLWLPFELVHTDYRLPLPPGSGSFPMSSNGLAAGNHELEALVHGICEVIERDSTAIWSAGGRQARRLTRVDLSTVDDPDCIEVVTLFEKAGLAVGVWETTSDIGVAAFRCELADVRPKTMGPVAPSAGMGCHPAKGVALLRALIEAAQGRLTRISGSRDDVPPLDYQIMRSADVSAAASRELGEGQGESDFRAVPTVESNTFEEDIDWLVARCTEAGLNEVVTVDLSSSGLDLPVVRVVIPGLEPSHESPGYVRGPRAKNLAGAASRPGNAT